MQKSHRGFASDATIITIRDWRPGEVDGKWVDVAVAWRNYFIWLRDERQLLRHRSVRAQ